MKKKKNLVLNRFGLLPMLYCEEIICIARLKLYCNRRLDEGWKIVLQEVHVCCNTVECKGLKLYSNTVYWVAVYCNTLHCIVAGRAAGGQVVSQYNLGYHDMRQGCLCRKTGSRVVIQQAGRWGA